MRFISAIAVATVFSIVAIAIEVPRLSGPVVDEYGLLQGDQASKLDAAIREMQRRSNAQMAILIPKTLQDTDIESYTMAVAEKWQLGKKGDDRGLLLVVAPYERKMRLEVGYGLEGIITDAHSRRLLNGFLQPAFRQGEYFNGLRAIVQAIGDMVADPEMAKQMLQQPEKRTGKSAPVILLLALLILGFGFVLPLLSHRGRGGRNDWWGGGGYGGGGGWSGGGGFGGGGGGFGGGGGGFGGGGSSSSW